MEQFLHDLWQLVSHPGQLRENLAQIVQTLGGPATAGMLGLIVFAETGLVVTPFLPGDSLLFAAGAVCATVASVAAEQGTEPPIGPVSLGIVLFVAAVAGDAVNYHVGRAIGPVAFSGRFRWLRKEHLDKTHAFFERHGGRAVVLARFVPIVRTFAPFVAGIGAMTYPRFLFYNVLGALVWVGGLLGLGWWLGGLEWVQRHFEKVVLAIIVLSVMPLAWEWWKALAARRAAGPGARPQG
jgi:membrane-associated protein